MKTNSRKILLTIAYKGTQFCGFQQQPGMETIEENLNTALTKIAGHDVKILGAGRTDAGVHARNQKAQFALYGSIPTDKIVEAVNGLLPRDIVVKKAEEVPESFHCRYDCHQKHYRYIIRNTGISSPFDDEYAYFFPFPLNQNTMKKAAGYLVGCHDFTAFTATNGGQEDMVRTIDSITVTGEDPYIYIDVYGSGFLYKMVRSIAGALIDVGRGYFTAEHILDALESKDRSMLLLTAPARGLWLEDIIYQD